MNKHKRLASNYSEEGNQNLTEFSSERKFKNKYDTHLVKIQSASYIYLWK